MAKPARQFGHAMQILNHHYWYTSIPKVAGSIPTVAKQTFQLARCGCILRVTSQTSSLFISLEIDCFHGL
jgi:hypothetical protein